MASPCTYQFVRGPNKGQNCPKLPSKGAEKCAAHLRLAKTKQVAVACVTTCLCGDAIDGSDSDRLCRTCSQHADIVTCGACARTGRLVHMGPHIAECHAPVAAIANTTMPVDEFRALDATTLAQPTGTCIPCGFVAATPTDMSTHAVSVHMVETRHTQLIQRPIAKACPVHGRCHMMGSFCRACMTRAKPGFGWNCGLCAETHISPPERHFQTRHVIRMDEVQVATVIRTCSSALACTGRYGTSEQWVEHFQKRHVRHSHCPLPGCNATLKCGLALASHFGSAHTPLYTYKRKQAADPRDLIKVRAEHVHNAIAAARGRKNVPIVYDVRQLASPSADIHRLAAWALAFKCPIPDDVMWSGERHVKACTELLRTTLVAFYKGLPTSASNGPSLPDLPPELFELVFDRLGYDDRASLSESCPTAARAHATSRFGKQDAMITWVRTNTGMFAFGPHGNMCASRARPTFMLTDDELWDLPVLLARNPHYRCAAPMRLYDAESLGTGIYLKFGTPEAFMAARAKRQARKKK